MSPPAEAPPPEGPTAEVPGLYVHVPFCARACPYCDFDFQVGRRPPVDAFLDGLERERVERGIAHGQPVRTVYLGGGTPSLLGPAGLRRLLGWIERRFDVSAAVERTVELNPEHVDEALLDALVEHGVDRVSLGVQSLGTEALVQLGRLHRGDRALACLGAAARRGLRVSADLIVGWPGQTAEQLEADLRGLVEVGVEHVSIYALTVESGTPWERLVARGTRADPDPDAQADRLEQTAEILEAAGFSHYEVASYGRNGALARHNLGYWRWRSYLGLGPSAASASYSASGAVTRRTNARGFSTWVAAPVLGAQIEALNPLQAAIEGLWTGLRVLTGLDPAAFGRRFGAVDEEWMRARAAPSVARGNLEWMPDGRLRVAPGRWLWHDEIGAALLAEA